MSCCCMGTRATVMFDFHVTFSVNRYGEIVNVNLVRDKKTGKPKGFCFLCYEDQRSTILAVDNLNGIKVRISVNLQSKLP